MDDTISRQWLMECVNEGWIKFDTEKDENRFIHLVRDIAPSAHSDFGAYCDIVYQIGLEHGRMEVINFVSSMNMCDEVNDEAYKKLVTHFENIPLEGGQE